MPDLKSALIEKSRREFVVLMQREIALLKARDGDPISTVDMERCAANAFVIYIRENT